MILCVDENMRLWLYANVVLRVSGVVDLYGYGFVWLLVCLLVRWHVGLLSAYRPPSFHKNTRPLSWWREGRRVFHSILFVTSFAKYVRFLLSNFITILVCFNPFGVVYQFCFGFIHT